MTGHHSVEFCRGQNGPYGSSLQDFAGRQAMMSIFGEAVTGFHIDDVSCQFQYNNSERHDVRVVTSGTGFNSNPGNGMARVGLTAGGVGASTMSSKDAIRYRPGHEALAQMTGRFVGAGLGVEHHLGIGDTQDRVTWGTKDGIPGVHFWEGTNKTFIPRGVESAFPDERFARDPIGGTNPDLPSASGFDWDPTKFNIFMPSYGWLGVAPILYGIHGGFLKGWLMPHYLDFINKIEEPHLQNPTLPLIAEVIRTSGDGEAFIETSSWRGGVVAGREEDNSSNRRFQGVNLEVSTAGSAGEGTHVLSWASALTFAGKENHVKCNVDQIISTNNINKDAVFSAYPTTYLQGLNPGFDPQFVPKDVDNSVLSLGIATVGGLDLGSAEPLDQGIIQRLDQRANDAVKGFNIYPADQVTIVLVNPPGGSGSVSIQTEGFELF